MEHMKVQNDAPNNSLSSHMDPPQHHRSGSDLSIAQQQQHHIHSTIEDHEHKHDVQGIDEPLHVTYTIDEVQLIAQEIRDETIAEVHLSLFSYWIKSTQANYELAKRFLRELALDQGYNTARIRNAHLRRLLEEVYESRPAYVFKANSAEDASVDESLLPPDAWNHLPKPPSGINRPQDMLSQSIFEDEKAEDANGEKYSRPTFAKDVDKWLGRRTSRGASTIAGTDHGADLAGPLRSPPRAYPPNTPDRPAPLSIRSPSSSTSAGALEGPVPLRTTPSSALWNPHASGSSSAFPRNTLMFQETAAHPLLSPRKRGSMASEDVWCEDDVFTTENDLEVCVGGGDEVSILDDASEDGDAGSQTQYTFATPFQGRDVVDEEYLAASLERVSISECCGEGYGAASLDAEGEDEEDGGDDDVTVTLASFPLPPSSSSPSSPHFGPLFVRRHRFNQ